MQKKIGIIQVDGKLPNLALMQITSYYIKNEYEVEWYQGNLFSDLYEKIFVSKIFSFTKMPDLPENAIIGGTGINWWNKLPENIINEKPSYELYPNYRNHIGFSMKGCRFKCDFCCVPQKEGNPYYNSSIDDLLLNPIGENRLVLLDNDFFGSPNWREDLKKIKELKLKVNFIQGLNIRIITKEQAELLSQVNYYNNSFKYRYLTFAWDRYDDEKLIEKGIKICNDAGIPSYKMQFFVLIGFNTTPDQDYYRVMRIKEKYGADPFVMPYNKSDPYQKKFTRWCNHRAIFNSVKWEDYKDGIRKH